VIEAAVEHGPHPTARTPELIALFIEDIKYQIKASFFRVFLWEELKGCLPANFKVSTVVVVPQVGQWGQIILNLPFLVYQGINGVVTVTQESVNESTVLTALLEAVKEIGKVIPSLLQYIATRRRGCTSCSQNWTSATGFGAWPCGRWTVMTLLTSSCNRMANPSKLW
jgi:hypothetical protein